MCVRVCACVCVCLAAVNVVDKGIAGCKPHAPCSACEGDCDVDADCKGALQCFKRTPPQPVPGCSTAGYAMSGTVHHDYCFRVQEVDVNVDDTAATTPVATSTLLPTLSTCNCGAPASVLSRAPTQHAPSGNQAVAVSRWSHFLEAVTSGDSCTSRL